MTEDQKHEVMLKEVDMLASVYEWDTQRDAVLLALWSERVAVAAGR